VKGDKVECTVESGYDERFLNAVPVYGEEELGDVDCEGVAAVVFEGVRLV